eukprot:jgi/Orpsp1_1/1188261/evm.model.d7180000063511.2
MLENHIRLGIVIYWCTSYDFEVAEEKQRKNEIILKKKFLLFIDPEIKISELKKLCSQKYKSLFPDFPTFGIKELRTTDDFIAEDFEKVKDVFLTPTACIVFTGLPKNCYDSKTKKFVTSLNNEITPK